MTTLELLVDLHKDSKRQGPGSDTETKRALDYIPIDQSKTLHIADIGCGTGAQTFVLAKHTNSKITAIDLFPEFLSKLNRKATQLGFESRIETVNQSMTALNFPNKTFDIIWSEGAIYNIGFEEGIKSWRKFITPNGYLAVSEITWTTNERPKEIEAYWLSNYAEIDTALNKINLLKKYGYLPISHFFLSSKSWLDNYYIPIKKKFDDFLNRHQRSALAKELIENEKQEIEIFNKYHSYYSYAFYIAQKNNY